jgi:hypothetical protein
MFVEDREINIDPNSDSTSQWGVKARRALPRLRHRTGHGVLGHPKKPVFDFRAHFVTLRPWKRTLSASDSWPTPRRARSDFLQ